MMMFTLKDSQPGQPLLLHDEPIYLDDKIIGLTTSGNYSFCFNKNLSFGYVNSGNTIETLKDKNIYIEVEKKKYLASILEKLNTKNYRKLKMKPKIGSNRSFGVVFFMVFLIISFWPLLNNNDIKIWSLVISIIFLILGLINSKFATPPK